MRWPIRPDGTINFAHGHPHGAVSIALEHDQDPVLALVHDPLRRETFVAGRGRRPAERPPAPRVDALERM